MDNRGKSRANTCKNNLVKRSVYQKKSHPIFEKKKKKVNHNIQADREKRKQKRQTEQISALSTLDGSIEGYGGYDG